MRAPTGEPLSRRRYWSLVVAFVAALLTVQSVMGLGIDKFKELWGVAALEAVAYAIVVLGAAGVVWGAVKLWRLSVAVERAGVAIALLIYAVATASARSPQERLHYLGYAILAILLYVGFARDRDVGNGGSAVLAAWSALAAGSFVGYADELLQIVWPRRYFDWADVAMNVVAIALGLLVAMPLWNAVQRRTRKESG